MISFTEIVACNGTVVYQTGKQMNFFTSGKLQVLLAYDGMLILRCNNFEYPINGSQTITYDQSDPQFSLVLYLKKYPVDQWIVKINQNTDAVFSCLDQKCYMKDKNAKYQKSQKVTARPQETESREVYLGNELEQKEDKNMFVEASKQVNKGLKFTGGIISKGFENLGGFISNRVEKTQEKEVSQNTKQNLQLAKRTTSKVLGFASTQVGNLFAFGKKVASNVGDKFQSSDKGKQLMEHPHYETVKNGAKTGVGVIANIYDGVVGAVYSAGSGMAKGVGKVVGAKYGQEAGEAADDAFQGAGNVLKIVRIPEDQIAKAAKE